MAARRYEEMGSTHQRTTVGGDSSSSSSSSPSSRAPDSLNGLKFGQKIYFGDVGLGVAGISGGGSSSSASPAAKKGRAAGVQSGQPPRCQVEGCDVDLSDAKAYYSRHKVCCMHSKSSKVVVGGIEQRFCQQCSRFHQLAEFDHGKRSCRRRLAGHNERRRKPPPGSLLSARLGHLSPSVFELSNDLNADSGSSGSGFLVDFTASLKAPDRSSWPGTKTAANHSTDVGKFLQGGAWPGHHPSSPGAGGMFLQNSAGGTNYQVGPTIPSGECFAGVTDSSCALSLLSNQDWSSGNRAPCIGPTNLLNTGGTSICQSSGHHTAPPLGGHFHDNPWGFKVGEASHGMNCVPSNLGLGQVSHPVPSRTASDELDMGQPPGGASGRQLVEFEHSSAYGSSTEHMHWLL